MRLLRFKFTDGTFLECQLKGFSTLPPDFKKSLSLQETKGGFWLTISESLVAEDKRLESIELK